MNKRLKAVRDSFGLNQLKFAESLNLKQSSYNQYETGKRSIPDSVLRDTSKKYQINLHWLLTGEGNMMLSEIDQLTRDLAFKKAKIDLGDKYKESDAKLCLDILEDPRVVTIAQDLLKDALLKDVIYSLLKAKGKGELSA